MEVHQGDIVWLNHDPTKGPEPKKNRPCLVVSNDNYNQVFNTVIVLPISSARKYETEPRFRESPLFMTVKLTKIHGTILLRHPRAISLADRSNGQVVDRLPKTVLADVLWRFRHFF